MTTMTQPTEAGGLHVTPALFEHAQKVFEAMRKAAEIDETTNGLLVYDGHLTSLFKNLRLSVPYYTQIKQRLTAMGCIEQLRRGGGNGTSRWVLWKEPTLAEWKVVDGARPRAGNKVTQLEQRIRDLSEQVHTLSARLERLESTK